MRCRTALPALLVSLMLLTLPAAGQVSRIAFPAGSPEDQALQTISNEQDPQKRIALYGEFVGQFSSTPAALAYGNWQISQLYLAAGDTAQALAYGDKAVAAMPDNLNLLVSQVTVAQQMKDNARIVDYAARGGAVFQGIGKQVRPEGMSAEAFEALNSQAREEADRKSTRLNSSHIQKSRMPSSA